MGIQDQQLMMFTALGVGVMLGVKITSSDLMLWSISGNKPKWYVVLCVYVCNSVLVSVVTYVLLATIAIIHRH